MIRLVRFQAVLAVLTLSSALVPASPGDAEDLRSQVDALFSEYRRTDSPGCALGVFRNGRIDYAQGYGMANLELGVAIAPSTVFDIGSTSKQFSAFAVLLLEQDGKLDIDDDVRKHLPEIPSYGPIITIRNLMQHTSGLRDYLGLFQLAGVDWKDVTTSQDALDAIVRQKALNFEPGDEYLYSNSGFFLLSEIVKRVSGKTLAEFARERIFEPLGMRHTRFQDDPQDIIPNRATGYGKTPEGELEIEMSDFEQTGDGAVNTTIEDLWLWDQNFYHPRVGTPEMLALMQTPGTLQSGKPIHYGLGLAMATYHGLKTVSHGGSWAGYRAELLRFPDQELSVACLCNLGETNPSELARKVAALYLGDRMTKEPEEPTPEEVFLSEPKLRSREGLYWNRASGEFRFLSLEGGKLVVDLGGYSAPLRPLAESRFVVEPYPSIEIQFEGDVLEVIDPDEDIDRFSRIEPWKPTNLEEFTGRYRSEEIEGGIEVAVERDDLVVRHRTIDADPLKPTRADSFYVDGLSLRFTRDPSGKVNGFLLDMGRVKGITYEKEK
jgi:CubicO group peptidase (beta-lactamase class C family)